MSKVKIMNLDKKQQEELKKKDKQIDLMVNTIDTLKLDTYCWLFYI